MCSTPCDKGRIFGLGVLDMIHFPSTVIVAHPFTVPSNAHLLIIDFTCGQGWQLVVPNFGPDGATCCWTIPVWLELGDIEMGVVESLLWLASWIG